MPSPCTASSHAISVKAFRWRTRSDHVTRNALAAGNNEAYGRDNGGQALKNHILFGGTYLSRLYVRVPEEEGFRGFAGNMADN